MCGRYGRRADKQRIAEWMETHDDNVFDESYFAPSFNIAPQSVQPIVRMGRDTAGRELTVMRWGLVPFWAKDSKVGFSTINARAEAIATSPAFREAWKSRRCLVPAEWFFEWKKIDNKIKQPHAISLQDGSMFAFAGLWDRWKEGETGLELETYTVITTDPNQLMDRPFPCFAGKPVSPARTSAAKSPAIALAPQSPRNSTTPTSPCPSSL